MVYNIETIAKDVRIAIDENNSSEQLISDGDIDTLSLDEIIRSKVLEAVRRVESIAPVYLLEEGHNFGDAVYWDEDGRGSGFVILPRDFMRLIAFRMSDWERTCYSAILSDDPLYEVQSSRYKGIRGNPQRPVCAIVNRAEGKALEFYSCKNTDAYVSRGVYIPYPEIDEDGGVDISERCYTSAVYTTASLVLSAYGAEERASAMTALANQILEL